MSEILIDVGIYPSLSNGPFAPEHRVRPRLPDPDAEGGVAITGSAYTLQRIVEESSMRRARLRAIQCEIEAGTYETSERIRGTVDRLFHVIR